MYCRSPTLSDLNETNSNLKGALDYGIYFVPFFGRTL